MRSVRTVRLRQLTSLALLGMAFIALTLQAQDAPPPAAPAPAPAQPATTQPAAVVAAAPAKEASTQPSTKPTTQASDAPPKPAEKISLNFKDAQLDAVLDFLSSAAGFVVVKEGKVEGTITVVSKQPVTAEMAVTILSAALKTNGFTAIQEGRVLRVLSRDKARKGSIPVYFGSDPEMISPTDELITQIIQLRNVDAVKALAELKPLMNVESADATAISASNSIVITDSSSNIRRIARIIRSLDGQETSSSDIRVVQLKTANATAAAKLIGEIFKGGGGGGMSREQIQMMQMQGQPVPAGGGAREGFIPGGAIDQALRGGRVTATADERTNTIIVTGPTETLKVVDKILGQLDENETAGNSEMRVFPLTNAQAEETSKLITSIFKGEENNNSSRGYYWDYDYGRRNSGDSALKVKVEAAFDERTNSVIVTAPLPTLKVIEGLIKQLDTDDTARADLRVFQLKNAEAFSVSILLEDIFAPKETDNDSNFRSWYFGYGSSGNTKKSAKMTAVSDDRTNTVIVTAPTEMMKMIGDVINQLDTNPVSEESMFIVHLRNAQSDNLEIVLNTLFGNINPPQNQDGQTEDEQRQQQFRENRQNRSNGDSNSNNSNNSRSSRNSSRNNRRNNQNQNLQRAASELTGKVFVVADVDTNSLLVTTASRYQDQVRQIVNELDRPVPQVLIKVLLAEVTHNDSIDYGVDFSVLNRRPSGLGQVAGTNFGNAAATGGLVVSVLEENVQATLRAIQSEGKLDVLSRPYILASDNQLASIQVGQEIVRLSAANSTSNGQNNSFTYEDIGIILDVTPHINPDGQVILDVAPEISTLSDQSITISPGVESPILDKRSAQSRVEVKSGQTVVIGGLMQDRKTSIVDKVPVLGDIPGIGEMFKRTRKTKVKTELLIFLTPHVAEGTNGLEEMSADEVQGTKLTPNAVGPGMFQQHMQGMRRGDMPLTRPSQIESDGYVPIRATEPSTQPISVPLSPEEPSVKSETPATQPTASGSP